MTCAIHKNYNSEEESRKLNSQKKKYELDKDAESENIIQPEVNTNLQNQQHNNQQYKFDVDVEETKSNQKNEPESLCTYPRYSAYKSYNDYINQRFIQRASALFSFTDSINIKNVILFRFVK